MPPGATAEDSATSLRVEESAPAWGQLPAGSGRGSLIFCRTLSERRARSWLVTLRFGSPALRESDRASLAVSEFGLDLILDSLDTLLTVTHAAGADRQPIK